MYENKVWLVVVLATTIAEVTTINITITSSPQLGVDTVCDNQDVTLMCHTDQTTGNMITWYWFNQSQHGDTITVVARMTGVVYTCVATSKDGQHLGNASITVVANGSHPVFLFCNFLPSIPKYEGDNLLLFCNISSNLPLSSGFPKWQVVGRPLPPSSVIGNHTVDGILYSSLLLHNISFEDDTGNYSNIVSNQCGTSSKSVYINVGKDPIACKDSGSLAGRQKSIMTVVGEHIKLECFFIGNLKLLQYSLYVSWEVSYPYGQRIKCITDNSTHHYQISVFQTCLSDDGSCCKFVDRLTFKASSEMNDANLACIAAIDGNPVSSTSNITVFKYPRLKSPSHHDIWATLNSTKTLQCQIYAPEMTGVTIMMWQKDNVPINSSQHYSIEDTAPPGIGVVTSTLTIDSVTEEDEGTFSCYCRYNEAMVTSDKPVISALSNIHLHIGEEGEGSSDSGDTTIYILIAGCGVVGIVVIIPVVVCVIRKRNRNKKSNRNAQQLAQQQQQNGNGGNINSNETTPLNSNRQDSAEDAIPVGEPEESTPGFGTFPRHSENLTDQIEPLLPHPSHHDVIPGAQLERCNVVTDQASNN